MSAQCASPRRPLFIPPDVEKFDFEPTRSNLLRIGASIDDRVRYYGPETRGQLADFFEDLEVILWLSHRRN
ncbi:hypothetical protein WH47_00156 [Habropoda laboriosa]|uniref:Uncharacterized protein n=1 Tax=Habropoda laboriosa TaxID=597456 RepID=A0A0L7R921_9HYME|nr:hypothetical protein WH47_00156 [Habropoda laboriosa]